MSTSLWVDRKINPWQQSQAFKAQKKLPHVDSITLLLFTFFFPLKHELFWVVCLSLCKHFVVFFFAMVGARRSGRRWCCRGARAQMSPSASWRRHLLFPLHPCTATLKQRKTQKTWLYLYIYYCHILKLLVDLSPWPLKVVGLSAAVWTIRIQNEYLLVLHGINSQEFYLWQI